MRLFGHPLHPVLVHFPIAFWILATICDGLAFIGFVQLWPYASVFLAFGLVLAVPAMVAVLVDLAGINDTAASVANRHMLLMSSAWTVYLVALLTRMDGSKLFDGPNAISIAVSGFGFCLVVVGGWYGGQLVYHHGVGTRFQCNSVPEDSCDASRSLPRA